MNPLSRPALIQTRNDTATRPTTVTSLQFKPTLIALSTGRLSGYNASFSNTTSTLPYQTGFSTQIVSATPSAALTTPLSHANHSTLAIVTLSSTHIVPAPYTTPTWETEPSSPTSDLTLSEDSARPTSEQGQDMSLETKVGLALIPIAVGLCAWGLVLLFLWRRRRMHELHHKLDSMPPSAPEKSQSHLLPSLGSSIKGSRVFTMAAFHSRDHRDRQTQVIDEDSDEDVLLAQPATPPPVRRSPSAKQAAAAAASDPDSPIDEESPFQLKRSETRRSLGAEISDLWPTPPPTAWAKRQDILNQLPSSSFGRDMSAQRPMHFSSRNRQRDMRDINRPSIAEYWPMI